MKTLTIREDIDTSAVRIPSMSLRCAHHTSEGAGIPGQFLDSSDFPAEILVELEDGCTLVETFKGDLVIIGYAIDIGGDNVDLVVKDSIGVEIYPKRISAWRT